MENVYCNKCNKFLVQIKEGMEVLCPDCKRWSRARKISKKAGVPRCKATARNSPGKGNRL